MEKEKTTIDDAARVIMIGHRVMVRKPRRGKVLAPVVPLEDYLAERKAEKKRAL